MATTYDLRLGRISLPTVRDPLSEQVGDQLETVADAVFAGERRARSFPIRVSVHGDRGEASPQAAGQRLRRQVRALVENRTATIQGTWFQFAPDPELDAVLLIGGGDLGYTDPGWAAASDFVLDLKDVYKAGGPRTHRLARRTSILDRRVATTPLDSRGRIVPSTGRFATTAIGLSPLPVGATNAVAQSGLPNLATRASLFGDMPVMVGTLDANVATFDQPASGRNQADAVIFDRRGATAPTTSLTGDQDPQTVYGWEEVYGPDQPLTSGDVPTVENGLCRLRWLGAATWALDAYVAGTGYVEQGRIEALELVDTAAAARVSTATVLDARVAEWSPERAQLQVTMQGPRADSSTVRVDAVVTLRRGWTAPRIELYSIAGTNGNLGVRLVSASTGNVTTTLSNTSNTRAAGGAQVDFGAFASPRGPWVAFTRAAGGRAVQLAVLRTAIEARTVDDSAAYGSSRAGVEIRATAAAVRGYLSVTFGVGPTSSADLTRRGAGQGYDGAQDLGESNLMDSQPVPLLVAR